MTLPVFPTFPGVAFPVTRTGPIFDTIVQDSVSGKQTAYPKRVTPRWSWDLPFDILRSGAGFAEMQTLAGFYASRFGRAYPFAYTDAEDNAVANQVFGLGDGTTTLFQLVRTMAGFTEPVFLPVAPAIFVAGGQLAAGTDYTLLDGGQVSFAVAPAASAPLTWTGSFNWLCRFDEDNVAFARFMTGLWEVKSLKFSSVVP